MTIIIIIIRRRRRGNKKQAYTFIHTSVRIKQISIHAAYIHSKHSSKANSIGTNGERSQNSNDWL